MAIVKMAATTEEEGRERRDRVEDAIFASQAALEQGVVAGGGYALLYASAFAIDSDRDQVEVPEGQKLFVDACREPMRQILRNAGKKEIDDIVLSAFTNCTIFNVVTDQFEDQATTNIVDPLKVVVTAFENALSVALLALTTEVVVADKEIKD
jgi:chaperonin GroEL